MTTPATPASPSPGNAPQATPKVIGGNDQAANEALKPADRTPSGGQAPPDTPAPGAAAPQAAPDVSDEAAQLEARLAEVRARASGQETVKLKVEGPHVEFIHGGVSVYDDFTAVPAHLAPAMMEAAASSGVTLTQEEV
jgi:hypothetical protein